MKFFENKEIHHHNTLTILTERSNGTNGNQFAAKKLIDAIKKMRPELNLRWCILDPRKDPLAGGALPQNVECQVLEKWDDINPDFLTKENNMILIFPQVTQFPTQIFSSPDLPLIVQCNEYDCEHALNPIVDVGYVSGLGKNSLGIFIDEDNDLDDSLSEFDLIKNDPCVLNSPLKSLFQDFSSENEYISSHDLFFGYYSLGTQKNYCNSRWGLYKDENGAFDREKLRENIMNFIKVGNWYKLSNNKLLFSHQLPSITQGEVEIDSEKLKELNLFFREKGDFSALSEKELEQIALLTKHNHNPQREFIDVDDYILFSVICVFKSLSDNLKKGVDLVINMTRDEAIFLSIFLKKLVEFNPEDELVKTLKYFKLTYNNEPLSMDNQDVEKKGTQIRIFNPFPLKHDMFKALLKTSHDLAGLAGDQSFCEGVKKTILYSREVFWKANLINNYLDFTQSETSLIKELFDKFNSIHPNPLPLNENNDQINQFLSQIKSLLNILAKDDGKIFSDAKKVGKRLSQEKNLYKNLPQLIFSLIDDPLNALKDNPEALEKARAKIEQNNCWNGKSGPG